MQVLEIYYQENLLGAKDYRSLIRLSNKLIIYGVIIGGIIAIIGGLLYYPIGDLFTNDKSVLKEFYDVFWIVLSHATTLCASIYF